MLKTTDVSKIVEIKDLKVEVENYDTKLDIVEFEGKFTSVDLASLEVQFKCPKCNNTVSIQDEIAILETVQLSPKMKFQVFHCSEIPCH